MLKQRGRQIVNTASVPAPTGGLNARDALANMPETDAVQMENWFPSPTSVDIRNGYAEHATGFPGWVETVAVYNGASTKKIFGASDDSIFEATSPGPVGAADVTGLTNAQFQYTNVGTAGGRFLLMVNGADKLQGYDGSNWWEDGDGAHDITGIDTSTVININLFKNRVFLIPENSFSVFYLGLNSIAGAATEFNLSTLFKLGGYLMTMANWTIDNAAGIDDYAAFISSEGEVAIYKGTDPSSASTWALVGIFRIGRPIGRRCTTKVGSDVIIICADGAFALSRALLTDRSQIQEALTDKITNLINADVRAYANKFGWQPILYPIGNKLIINVPQVENSIQYQYVMNTITGSWCKFTGWNAACWEFYNDGLYFGGNTAIYQADVGQDDNGANIVGNVQQAYSYFKQRGQIKRFTMVRPIFSTDGNITAAVKLNTDFSNAAPTSVPTFTGTSGSAWDTSPWDTTPWGGAELIVRNWQTVTGVGFSGGLRMQVAAKNLDVKWQSTDFTYEVGGIL